MTEAVHVGQRLGSENSIRSMRFTKTWGWIARDSTGAEYAQRRPRNTNVIERVVVPDGLSGLPWPRPQ